MNYDNNRLNAHNEIDHIFKDLLPTRNMAERPEQVALCHRMLDAMLEGGIALCDAGTGIGKTYAYLVAGTVYSRFRAVSGLEPKPILVSTSSIALQNAVQGEYLPLLSGLLLEDSIIAKPLQAVIRKGKSHYVCDARLERRLGQLNLQKKNWKAGAALLALRKQLDVSEAAHLSGYDRERVCVPKICDCGRETCRYLAFWEDCNSGRYLFQICNHNLLLADTIHRGSGRRPILPDACALIVDEAHKLPETARQMFGVTLTVGDIRALTHSLRGERFLLAAGAAWEGFDFPGDCVSLLIIPRLPFAVPDALKEKERENHPTLRLFIQAVVVPEMQIKLKQGFGRAIRTETDTCVVAILDERAAQGKRYFEDMLAALPEMPITGSLEDVAKFIRSVKGPDYFQEGCA